LGENGHNKNRARIYSGQKKGLITF
jgi:hypothetical protein